MLGNLTALALLVDGLIKAKSSDLGGGELLLTGFAIWAADVIVFGLNWELDARGPVIRQGAPAPDSKLLPVSAGRKSQTAGRASGIRLQ